MNKKKVLKFRPLIITLNILVLFVIVIFYSCRLIKYYRLEHKVVDSVDVTLSSAVLSKQSYVDTSKGLVYDENDKVYRYKGEVEDNYVNYSGLLFRVVSVSENGDVKLVSDSNLTLMYSGLENGYDKSFVNKWLNNTSEKNSGVFENNLYKSSEYLVNSTLCSDIVSDVKNITCKEKNNNNKITLLSLYEYMKSGGNKGYLNNSSSYYLSTTDKNSNNYYVTETGEVGLNKSNSLIIGVRPVITIKSSVIKKSGSGTKSNPYYIEKHEINKLNQVYVGSYINYSGNTYRVVDVKDEKVKIALNGSLKDKNLIVSESFSKSDNSYSDKTIIGKYLNETFYKTLKDSNKIVKSDWYIGSLNLSNLDYSVTYNSKTTCNIGLLGLSDLFIGEIKNVFTLSKGINGNNIINVINKDGKVYGDLVTNKYNIRPALYLKGDIPIVSGIGSEYGPYELGVSDEKEKAKK